MIQKPFNQILNTVNELVIVRGVCMFFLDVCFCANIIAWLKKKENKEKDYSSVFLFFWADTLLADPNKVILVPQIKCTTYEFTTKKFDILQSHDLSNGCETCGGKQD